MSIQQLVQVVAPPEKPLETGDEAAWQIVQTTLKIALPYDLRDLANTFGSGMFDLSPSIWVYHPFSRRYFNEVSWFSLIWKNRLVELAG